MNDLASVTGLTTLINWLQVFFALMRDRSVSFLLKIFPVLGILYFLTPFDDMLQSFFCCGPTIVIDDITIMALSMVIFVALCPNRLVEAYKERYLKED